MKQKKQIHSIGIEFWFWQQIAFTENFTQSQENDVFMKYDLAHLRHRADGVNLTNEWAVGLKE